ncbi:MAG: MFS transporter [Humibacillus sp.]|nr:MFS transporter [Humibacillus sp.]MDN5778577.1 MFS transporter [Humibacillus sp.]
MTTFQARAVIGASIATLLLAQLDTNIVTTAAPSIAGSFGGSALGRVPWLVTAYALAETVAQPLYGKLADRHGPRAPLLGALLLFLLGSLACASAWSMTSLVLLRVIQGLGAAGLLTVTFVLLGQVRAEGEHDGGAAGNAVAGVMLALGLVAGPILGGTVVEHVSWRWVFLLNVPIVVVVLVVTATCLRVRTAHSATPIDWVAASLLATTAISLQLLCLRLDDGLHQTSPWALGALGVLTVASLGAFGRRQKVSSTPYFPPELLSDQTLRRLTALQLATGVGLAAATVYVALELQLVDHQSPLHAAFLTLPMAGGVLVGAATGALLLAAHKPLRLSFVLANLLAAAALGLLAWTTGQHSIPVVWIALLLLGVGVGTSLGNEILAVQGAVDIKLLGTATAGVRFVETVGTSVGSTVFAIAFAQIAFAHATAGAGQHDLVLAIRLIFLFGSAAMIVATLVATRLPPVISVAPRASELPALGSAR